jgi:hypothetical protein
MKRTDTVTCWVTYILLTTAMNLIWTGEISDTILMIWDLFEILNSTFSKFYNTSEYLAAEETIISFKQRVSFKQNTLKKNKRFTIQVCKLCDSTGYMYDMKIYWGKDRQSKAQRVTATNVRWQNWSGRHRNMATIAHAQFSYCPWIIWWIGQETDLLLQYCQTKPTPQWNVTAVMSEGNP